MKEQIDRILKTEKEVHEKIEESRDESRKIIKEAEARSREIVDEGRKEAFERSKGIVEGYKSRAEVEREKKIGDVKAGNEDFFSDREGEIKNAIGRIAEIVSDPGK